LERLYTVAEVAERLAVSRQTVYNWLWSGDLPRHRIGLTGRVLRIRECDLEEYLARRQAHQETPRRPGGRSP
jgi:excisionase family DNA binding protein